MKSTPLTADIVRTIVREELERALNIVAAPEVTVDANELARILNVSTDTVYRMARTGDIPGHKLGQWRFWPSEVRAHISRPRDPWQQSNRSRARKRIT